MAPTKASEPARAGDPTVATLLTWLVPGAGHLYAGRVRIAVIGFCVVELLYLAGVWLSSGMFLEYLPAEMRGRFAAALTPEVGNLGALILHIREHGFGDGPRPWPPYMDLGTTLTATSGFANMLLMSHANFSARAVALPRPLSRDPGFCALMTWVVPGLGHVLQGRRARGITAFVLLVGLFALGTALAAGSNLDRERHFYYWAGQFLLGPVEIVTEFVHGHPRMEAIPEYKDAGVVIGCIAGMLNVLLMLDVFGVAESRALAGASSEPRVTGAPAA